MKILKPVLAAMLLASLFFTACAQDTNDPAKTTDDDTPTDGNDPDPVTSEYVAGYEEVAEFGLITAAQIAKVQTLKIFFQHASVGANVCDGIEDLKKEINATGTPFAIETSGDNDTIGQLKTWYAANSGWGEFQEGNPDSDPSWSKKITDFKTYMTTNGIGALVNVAMMKFCYIDPSASFADYRDAMLELEAAYPAVTFIWWTMPITSSADYGSDGRKTFNAAVRSYAKENKKYLFDLADIECHETDGTKRTDSSGELLCEAYTDDGGHLNQSGRDRAAQAMWVLLSRIAK